MYHPGHLLHLGLETGWVRFYSYTIDNNGVKGTTELNATPLLFVYQCLSKNGFMFLAAVVIILCNLFWIAIRWLKQM